MKKRGLILVISIVLLTSCTLDNSNRSTNGLDPEEPVTQSIQLPSDAGGNDDDSSQKIDIKLIDETKFKDAELLWVKMINQDVKAVAGKDVQTISALRNLDPDPALMPAQVIESVTFMQIVSATDHEGKVRVDYRFHGSEQEPQYAIYSFERLNEAWIISDVSIDVSYKPEPDGKFEPKYIDESKFSGVQLEWIKVINQDIKVIADGDEAAFDVLRKSDQSLSADIPLVPVSSIEVIEVLEESPTAARIQVDRRKWGNDDVPVIMTYVLVNEDDKWLIADVD